jgi:hypothetical protein
VVVVTGTVVGVVVVGAGLVVVGALVAGVVPPDLPDVVVVVFGVVVVDDVVVLEAGELLVVVVGEGTMTAGLAAPARYTTARAETTPEPTKRAWVSRRTRANRRSRCWGVRVVGVIF